MQWSLVWTYEQIFSNPSMNIASCGLLKVGFLEIGGLTSSNWSTMRVHHLLKINLWGGIMTTAQYLLNVSHQFCSYHTFTITISHHSTVYHIILHHSLLWDPFTSFIDPHGHYDTPCHGPVRSFILLRSSAASSSTLFRRQDCRSKSNLPSRVGAGRVHTWLDRAILDRHWNEISCWLVFSGSGRILLFRLVGSLK